MTQQFADGFIQRMIGSFGSVIVPVLSCISCTFGFLFAVFSGIFLMRSRVMNTVRINPAGIVSLSNGVLDAKLAQLEEARRNNLITEEEYQRMRKDALDSLR